MAASRRNRASRQNGEDENQRDRAFHRRHSLAISFDDSQKGGLPGLTCPRRPFRYSTDGLQTRSARARQASRRSWPFSLSAGARKSGGEGKSVSVRVDLGGGRI